jgi:hypothetical protein
VLHQTRISFASEKHSSLFGPFVIYEENESSEAVHFISVVWICNEQKTF